MFTNILNKRYELKKIIHQSEVGKIYFGWDCKTKSKVIVKQIICKQNSENTLKSFQTEYYFLSSIDYPAIVKVYDLFEHNGHLYLVKEFVQGELLSDVIAKQIPLIEKLSIALQISYAIEIIDQAQIIHRNVCPNIIMVDKKKIKILELGLAKSSQKILAYTNPEQIDKKLIANSPVFSLAVVLYQFFLGLEKSPFQMENNHSTITAICNLNLPLLEKKLSFIPKEPENIIYEEISQILACALRRDSKRSNIVEFRNALSELYLKNYKENKSISIFTNPISPSQRAQLKKIPAGLEKYLQQWKKNTAKPTSGDKEEKLTVVLVVTFVITVLACALFLYLATL